MSREQLRLVTLIIYVVLGPGCTGERDGRAYRGRNRTSNDVDDVVRVVGDSLGLIPIQRKVYN